MTGFGAASGEGSGVVVQVEARSVNHRHLQLKVRLPAELGALEPKIDGIVRKALERGSVTVGVTLQQSATQHAAIDAAAAKRYAKELAALAKELALDTKIDLQTVLGLPGVVAADQSRPRTSRELKVVLGAVMGALEGLVEMREREGAAMQKDLLKHLGALRKLTAKIEKRTPTVVKNAQAGLKKRVEALLDGRQLPDSELAREVALLADRGDVSEELARLASHLDQLEGLVSEKDGAVGRQLDFLVQELFRELNTIGSKCGDAKLAHWVVEGKTLVERLREQVQNVE